jgi:tRNA1(Val) A37 N6-methylase TrmN6
VETTRDTLFDGAVALAQPARGYRVNVDALLLGAFAAESGRARHALDLGAGVGAATLALVQFGAVGRVSAIERDPELARLCRENLAARGLDASVTVADVSALPRGLAGTADLVIANPPFFEAGERRAGDARRERARGGALAPFLRAARRALGARGARAAFVYPTRSLSRFLDLANAAGLVPKRLRLVHPFATEPARVALVELYAAKPGGLVVDAPLIEWRARNVRSPELSRIIAGRAGDRR